MSLGKNWVVRLEQRSHARALSSPLTVSATMDGPTLSALFREHAVAHKVLDRQEGDMSAKLTAIGNEYWARKAKAVVVGAEGRAVLWTYGADSTPMLCTTTVTAKAPGAHSVVRKAGRAVGFLVQKAFVKTSSASGDPVLAVVL